MHTPFKFKPSSFPVSLSHWSIQTQINTKHLIIAFFHYNRWDSKNFLICFFFSFWSFVATDHTKQIVLTCPIKKVHGSGNKRKKDSFSDFILRRIVVEIPVNSLIDTTNIKVGRVELERRFTKIDASCRYDSAKLKRILEDNTHYVSQLQTLLSAHNSPDH